MPFLEASMTGTRETARGRRPEVQGQCFVMGGGILKVSEELHWSLGLRSRAFWGVPLESCAHTDSAKSSISGL